MGLSFVIAMESPIAPQAAKGSLHGPASRQHLEGVRFVAFDNFDGAAQEGPGPLDQSADIVGIGPDLFDAWARRLGEEGGQELRGSGTFSVSNVGTSEHFGHGERCVTIQRCQRRKLDAGSRIFNKHDNSLCADIGWH